MKENNSKAIIVTVEIQKLFTVFLGLALGRTHCFWHISFYVQSIG